MHCYDVVIAGAGPAGIACAIELKHAGVNALLVNNGKVGGLVRNAYRLRNLPGFLDLSGQEICARLSCHLEEMGISVLDGSVSGVVRDADGFRLKINDDEARASFLVAATGTIPRRKPEFEIPGRTFYEVSTMAEIKDAMVAVVGAGEAGLDSALSLAANSNKVIVLGQAIPKGVAAHLLGMVRDQRNICLKIGDHVRGVRIKSGSRLSVDTPGGTCEADYILISVGRDVNLSFIGDQNILSSERMFLCGDVRGSGFRQCGIAIGDGISVAMQISLMRG